jgi:hypothetical protein
MGIWLARAVPIGIIAIAAYGFWQGTPQDVVNAVRSGNVKAFQSALARDPANVHTKVYAQAYESLKSRSDYISRTGKDPWGGRYLVHDAVEITFEPLPMLEALLAGGADFNARLDGRTLLHLAAAKGDLAVATWLLDHGADIHAVIDCADGCAERGYTPLHSGLAFRDDEMTALLLVRGARVEAVGANGRTAMHVAADRGLGGAFVLARHGADLTRTDAAGKTPFDLAGIRATGADITDADLAKFAQWFAPRGPFATVSAMVRANGSPMSEEAAREVFATLPTTPRP